MSSPFVSSYVSSSTGVPSSLSTHKLLIANRGEIALRILHVARHLRIPTVALYTPTDAAAPHVTLADEAVLLPLPTGSESEAAAYLNPHVLLDICRTHAVTLVHPGYGFLAESAQAARILTQSTSITWLGPHADVIAQMGIKHVARVLAARVGVPVVPGSGLSNLWGEINRGEGDSVEGIKNVIDGQEPNNRDEGALRSAVDAVQIAEALGFPVILKASAGGGGHGLCVCEDPDAVRTGFEAVQARALVLYGNDEVFMERYIPAARHIEVQVFGNGMGHVIHMGERECSIQRRHQKLIEESPSPFMCMHPDVRSQMCDAAIRLCREINYSSAGTVEFLVDDVSGEFYFLEMNTRIQVEHPVTEARYPGLDIVELMILQGIAEHDSGGGLAPEILNQRVYEQPSREMHAIEARVYCENPAAGFVPCPGVLQYVEFPHAEWLRVDTWVETGTTVTPHFDPLVCKLIVTAPTRIEAIARLSDVLDQSKIYGPPTNKAYLHAISKSDRFLAGDTTTSFLDIFSFTPRAMEVLSGGLETTVQDYPGRRLSLGIPRSGPMDSLAFRVANLLVGNAPHIEALELTLTGCRVRFHVPAVVAVTGANARVTVDGREVAMWARIVVPAGARLSVGTMQDSGFRAYLAIRGGFPAIPQYLGAKATSMGMGGYQGRALIAGDYLTLGEVEPALDEALPALPSALVPVYPEDWIICCLAGPHCDEEFVTVDGIDSFFGARWTVSASSNRMGIRLEGPRIAWARKSGGEGGSHPSNIHDNGYALGSVNVNGDTPVILTNEGPDMGGYVCMCTIVSADLWKLGQLRPGCAVRFQRISFGEAMRRGAANGKYLQQVSDYMMGTLQEIRESTLSEITSIGSELDTLQDNQQGPKLAVISAIAETGRPKVTFRQAGDSAILVEYGELQLDFTLRARIHAFEAELRKQQAKGVWAMCPCIRSTMIHFDPDEIEQSDLLTILLITEKCLPNMVDDLTFPGRKITFPIVLDDRWNRDALQRYMRAIRNEAVYLPSNIEYLARNNGLEGGAADALKLLVSSDWLVFGVGFYLSCPFLIPIDPRCRLVGQKMNPSRTYTPRGALGIAGLVAAIYPIESPGGYQLYGRTLPPWQTWGRGKDFNLQHPWLLQPFDQIAFEPVSEKDYTEIERQFDGGQYKFKIEPTSFSVKAYNSFVSSIAPEIAEFKRLQAIGIQREEAQEDVLFKRWDEKRRKILTSEEVMSMADVGDAETGDALRSSLSASVWKINCAPGDVIQSAEDALIVLEAMKTEVKVEAGDEFVGRTVKGLGRGVKEGTTVRAGDVLVLFED